MYNVYRNKQTMEVNKAAAIKYKLNYISVIFEKIMSHNFFSDERLVHFYCIVMSSLSWLKCFFESCFYHGFYHHGIQFYLSAMMCWFLIGNRPCLEDNVSCLTRYARDLICLRCCSYSISQEICTRFLLYCALLWLYIDWFSHIHQAYFTGIVAI